jgi:hypothetical protein
VLQSARMPDRHEIPFTTGVRYVAFTDPAGGTGGDSFTLAIAHAEHNGRVVLDVIREVRPPLSPETVTEDFAGTIKNYRLKTVHGDHYAGAWPRERFSSNGVHYDTSERTKSELYLEALPLFTTGRVELLDNDRLIKQFGALERKTARSGKDSIDHPPRQHDDLCNAAAGALVLAATPRTVGAAMAHIPHLHF